MRDVKRLAIAVAALAGAATSSVAQGYGPPALYPYNAPPPYGYGYPDGRPLSPDALVDRLEAAGYDDVGRPRYDGLAYLVDATERGGVRVRLVVDPRHGHVLRRIALRSPMPNDQDEDDTAPLAGRDRRPAVPYGARPPSPYDEMPMGEPPRPVQRREASRPVREPRALVAPADPRLAPADPVEASPPTASAPPPSPPGGLFGTNPDKVRSKPKESIASRPAKPAAPAPKAAAPPVTSGGAEASAEPRKPVRVIDGVTPMNITPPRASPGQPAVR